MAIKNIEIFLENKGLFSDNNSIKKIKHKTGEINSINIKFRTPPKYRGIAKG